ncbi:FAD-dependent monooxygenase [Brevibacterium daeguense]|uniref:FAD-dependent monooxygenase n=1 Tax=Brevibacterium daeguense TaxID=909936 RepID=A0ABP8EIG2_9MICO|nr:FAD-dependent monooxygenase [Brevibacterium daeguense]
MKAIVIGAGIAGLVVARQLGLAGWEVELLEKSPGPRRDGYMMDFFGPGVEASERIGLYARLAAAAYRVQAVEYVDPAGRKTARLDYRKFSRLAGGKVLSLLRPDIERAALDALDDVPAGRVRIHYRAQATRMRVENHGVSVTVNGSPDAQVDADVLIGADGIHSGVRADLFGLERQYLRPLGMRAAAFIAPDAELHARFENRFVLTDSIGRTAGFYGVGTNEVAAFLVYRDSPEHLDGPGSDSPRERLRREFTGLGASVDRLLDLCPEHPYDDIVAQILMPTWTRRRVVLVGDASGAVSLLAGQGGSLAIAGAALLGEILGPVDTPGDITPALVAFEQRWRPVVEAAQASGRRAASTFLPANRAQRFLRRWVIRGTAVPGIDRLVARQILRSIAT